MVKVLVLAVVLAMYFMGALGCLGGGAKSIGGGRFLPGEWAPRGGHAVGGGGGMGW